MGDEEVKKKKDGEGKKEEGKGISSWHSTLTLASLGKKLISVERKGKKMKIGRRKGKVRKENEGK